MTIKKELLNELTETQLKQLAEYKGISFSLNDVQEKYYENWEEKDKLVDLMSDQKTISVSEIDPVPSVTSVAGQPKSFEFSVPLNFIFLPSTSPSPQSPSKLVIDSTSLLSAR